MKTVVIKVKVLTKKLANKVVTFRFTLNPRMEAILTALQRRFSILDKTEIVKVALSRLAYAEGVVTEDAEMEDLSSVVEKSIIK